MRPPSVVVQPSTLPFSSFFSSAPRSSRSSRSPSPSPSTDSSASSSSTPPPMAAATDPMANSSADLSSRLSIDASKVKDKDRAGDKDKDRDKDKEKGGDKDKDEPQNSNASSAGDSNLPQDSLSLMQLKRVVGDMARVRQPEYAFVYASSHTLKAELNEWFCYSFTNNYALILSCKDTFEDIYPVLSAPPHLTPASLAKQKPPRWNTSKDVKKKRFISRCADLLENTDQRQRIKGLQGLCYVVQGVYGETESEAEQLYRIERNVALVRQAGVVESLFNCVRGSVGREWDYAAAASTVTGAKDEAVEEQRAWNKKELRFALTVLYFLIEVTRRLDDGDDVKYPGENEELESLRDEFADLPVEGGMLGFLAKTLSRLRWEDNVEIPLMSLLLITWKTILLVLGSQEKHLPAVKIYARTIAGLVGPVDKTVITASPLDYQSFRQDIIAKYPVYNPPKSLFPFEFSTNSFLPTVSTTSTSLMRAGGNGDVNLGGRGGMENLSSILDKAVHIATPAPSPPPSPGGVGGKGGKKQNYQTNNSFPFLYPTSSPGGTVSSTASKCWWKEDCDPSGDGVPASIKEAGNLFSDRVRSTLGMKQMWAEKEAYLKYDRGWDVDDEILQGRRDTEGRERRWEEKRLESVEEFYRAALPQLQSFVIVLLKVILANVTAPPPQPPPPPPANTTQVSFAEKETGWFCAGSHSVDDDGWDTGADPEPWTSSEEPGPDSNNNTSSTNKQRTVVVDPATGDADFGASIKNSWKIFGGGGEKGKKNGDDGLKTIDEDGESGMGKEWQKEREAERAEREAEEKRRCEETDAQRVREITSKAVSSILLGLLKWLRVSHVLKFEYLTQLLLDSNYLPLVLKIFNQQDTVAMVTTKTDRRDMSYFYFCNQHSLLPLSPHSTSYDSDEACPPPVIKYHHNQSSPPPPPDSSTPDPIPSPPDTITDFSSRNFLTAINFLRVMQKMVKGKAHRNLALVQYKSSAILRKPLKCQQKELWLYTLKLFKGQVPYCGRKWRQSNMRVITNIYLYCRPELRDDWLAGGDVDGEVEESLPQEQALRSLTQFHNVRRYPKSMGADMEMLAEERDFFRRELVKMELLGTDTELVDIDGGGGASGEWADVAASAESWN